MKIETMHHLNGDPAELSDPSQIQLRRMQELVRHLLLKNQQLRMELSALDVAGNRSHK